MGWGGKDGCESEGVVRGGAWRQHGPICGRRPRPPRPPPPPPAPRWAGGGWARCVAGLGAPTPPTAPPPPPPRNTQCSRRLSRRCSRPSRTCASWTTRRVGGWLAAMECRMRGWGERLGAWRGTGCTDGRCHCHLHPRQWLPSYPSHPTATPVPCRPPGGGVGPQGGAEDCRLRRPICACRLAGRRGRGAPGAALTQGRAAAGSRPLPLPALAAPPPAQPRPGRAAALLRCRRPKSRPPRRPRRPRPWTCVPWRR